MSFDSEEFIKNWGQFNDEEVRQYAFNFIDVYCMVKEAYEKGLADKEKK
jgi:hypothetical protein